MRAHFVISASVLALGGALLGAWASPARAETGSFGSDLASRFAYEEQQRGQSARHIHLRPSAPAAASAPAPRPARPVAVASRKTLGLSVAVFGDRLGQTLARGLDDDAGTLFAVNDLSGEDAALTRRDFTDWLGAIRTRLQKADKPAVALMMLGSNDETALPDGGASVDPADPRWSTLYAGRIDAVSAVFHEAHVPLIWVGLPSVHGEAASAEFTRLNALFRDRAGKNGIAFVDSWEAFSDDAGRYSPMGPNVDGQIVKLRKADGFSFTRAGARKLASFVEGDIKRLNGSPLPAEAVPQVADITIERAREFDSALDIDVNAQIQREAGLFSGAGKPALPSGPAAGPVQSLNAAPLSANGQLATGSVAPNVREATLLVPPSAETGTPKPGRADDFAWPKP